MMILLLNLALAFIALVHGQGKLHLTPNIAAVEKNIQAGQKLSSLNELRDAIGLPASLTLSVEEQHVASNGLERQKLRLHYNGVPFRSVRLQASMDSGDYTGAVSGYYPQNIPGNFDVSSQRSDAELKAAVANFLNTNDDLPPFLTSVDSSLLESFSSEKQIDIDFNTGALTLVYFTHCTIDVATTDPNASPQGAYIRFPRILFRESDLQVMKNSIEVMKAHIYAEKSCPNALGGNEQFPGKIYSAGPHHVCLKTRKSGNSCQYANDNVILYNVNNMWDRDNADLISFDCDGGPHDEVRGYSPSSDVFHYSDLFYSVLQEWAGVQGTGLEPIKAFVHFGDSYPNCFFDGQSITFGDGSDHFNPFTVSEVVGHELCHAFTEGRNNLQFSMESLAINEAFSDICGKAVSVFDTEENDWMFARSIVRDGGQALRYFYNPPLDGNGIDHVKDIDSSKDLYSVMGIYTKFMYNVVAEQYVKFREAFQAVVFANQMYWTEESSLTDGACGVLRAASDLALDTDAFMNAFNDVGIDLDFCNLDGTLDVISCDGKHAAYIRRQPTVSNLKNPTYLVKGCSSRASRVYIKVSSPEDSVAIFSESNDVSGKEDNIYIDLGPNEDVIVGIKSDSIGDVEDVKVAFAFFK